MVAAGGLAGRKGGLLQKRSQANDEAGIKCCSAAQRLRAAGGLKAL